MLNIFTSNNEFFLVGLITLWTIPWKGVALWKSARSGSKVWFIILLIINTVGILEILYIFIFSKKASGRQDIHQNY